MRSEPEDRPWYLSGRSIDTRATAVQAWCRLAWQALEYSSTIAPALIRPDGLRFGLPRVSVWEDPGGPGPEQEPFTLTVYQPRDRNVRPVVRKAIWHWSVDLQRLREPTRERDMPSGFNPTLTVADATISWTELEEIVHSGHELRLPLVGLDHAHSVTCGGGTVGFAFYTLNQPQAKFSLVWSVDPPGEWQPAIDFALRLRTLLEGAVERSS
jgi:hypothetical protein